jgi:hypothetical protein
LLLENAAQIAHLDELLAIEVKALDMEPAARRKPQKSTVDRLGNMGASLVAMRVKKP